ncbi:codanin-1 isoform X1 [Osmia bicornis bicornis]|uniref:codanin-1 isoform X1 n=1 Tax=Osmia bicornis bicornis TaxID=1437191 RepID=UPI0010F6A392|nr:codanin-1 isoform X1 [Osmia bicornis bicornis]XP_029042322.1 codanin-1 isoform X1 [Osmia bicornis bicornis]
MGELNVCFQIDTDNRENFPSAITFQTFKNQRDTFYEIFRIWEENHSVPGWTFQIALGSKIRSMLTLHNDAINYYHFARLFKSQLLISCVQNKRQAEIDDENISFLKTLKCVNPKKLDQLQKRLVTPQPSKNQITGPSFPGVQEFFKDFILFAFNPIFYVHLENCLVHEIMELNDTQFSSSEIEDSDTMVDEQTQENFITCLSSLQLLAKILGLVVSLPYRSESNNFKELVATQVEVRSKVLPTVNLHVCLHNAITSGKLSLTVPWIAKYLAMLDVVSLRLPYYKQILELLYYIYKAVNQSEFLAPDNSISQQTAILLKSTLGWLFELPNFPKDYYPSWQETYKVKELQSLKQFDKHAQKNILSGEPVVSVTSAKYNLDKLDMINEKTLRICCPLAGLNVPAPNSNANINNCNSNKHITPVSSQLDKSVRSTGIKHLELQLEEAFFHGQPASTRKTVDFVSERVASTCVKHICNTLLMSSRETNLNNFRILLKKKQNERQWEKLEESLLNDTADFKAYIINDMNTLAGNMSKELKEQCETSIPMICEIRVTKSIESLLAEDSLRSVKEMCVKIATRLATERIHQWIQSHIVGGSLFIKDMELELNRFFRNSIPLHPIQEKIHNPNAISPTTITDDIRELIWKILDNGGQSLTITCVSAVLDNLYQTLNERADLVVGPEKVLYFLSTDFALFLVAYRSDLFTQKIQKKLIKVWTMDRWKVMELDSPMHRIFSSRNIMLLGQPEKEEIWLFFGKFIRKLIEKNVLDVDSFSDQCVALFRQDWPMPVMKHLSKCLTEVITGFKASDEKTEKLKYLLGWIAETYSKIEFCNDYSPID